MSEIKPTPGPWEAKPTGPWDGWDGWSVEDATGAVVCDAHGSQLNGRREANARLIAAAPELLEALREIFHDVKQGAIPNDDDEWWKKASTAIAKATGEQT